MTPYKIAKRGTAILRDMQKNQEIRLVSGVRITVYFVGINSLEFICHLSIVVSTQRNIPYLIVDTSMGYEKAINITV